METTIQEKICGLLDRLDITYQSLDHAPVMTMEEGLERASILGFTPCKSLFLCNKQQEYFMVLLPADKKFSAKNVTKQIGCPHLSFASKEAMEEILLTSPGAVSVLGLIHDKNNRVQLLIDKDIADTVYIGCHPGINTCSLKIKVVDILNVFLPEIRHGNYKVIEI